MRTFTHMAFASMATICLAIGALAAGTTKAASAAGVEVRAFDVAAKRQAIGIAAKLLISDYVYPDAGARAATMLTHNLESSKYDALTTPATFAAQMTKDLQDLTHDKHLNVFADGHFPAPAGPPLPRSLFGYAQADRLKGNVGYMVLNGFSPKPLSSQGADAAMGALASTDALIIDLRNNNGGDPAAVAYLVSFFFDGKTPVHINDLLWRKSGTTEYDRNVFNTEATFVSYLGKPVFVIVSKRTFSGGEELAYDMQALKRATLIGEVTGGGANPGRVVPIAPRLDLFLPTGRGENPITGTSWEGTGVQPDIITPEDQSFAMAYQEARKAVGLKTHVSDVTVEGVTEAHLLPPPRTTPAPGGEAALREWIAGVAEGRPPLAILGGLMTWVAEQQGSTLQVELKRLGTLKGLTFIEVDDIGQDVYEANFINGTVLFTLVMEPDGKIALCWQRPKPE